MYDLVINGVITKENAKPSDIVVLDADGNPTTASIPASKYAEHGLLERVMPPQPSGDVVFRDGVVLVDGVPTQVWGTRSYNAEELAEQAKEAADALKLSGVEFTDPTGTNTSPLMLSATAEDQNGLAAVNLAVINARGAGLTISPIQFSFENDTLCVITDDNFNAIYAVWAPFRQSFFSV